MGLLSVCPPQPSPDSNSFPVLKSIHILFSFSTFIFVSPCSVFIFHYIFLVFVIS